MLGSRPEPGFEASVFSATTRAAAAIISSLIRVARQAITPSPRPGGKTRALFACAMVWVTPLYSTFGNGEPVAIRARPSVHSSRSVGLASARLVGFDSGRMIGRSVCAAISRTTCSVNEPGWAEVPIRMVGRTFCTTSSRRYSPGTATCQSRSSSAGGRAYGSWNGRILPPVWIRPRLPMPQNLRYASAGSVPSRTISSRSRSAMPTPGGAGAVDDHPLIAEAFPPVRANRGEDGGGDHGGGALDVVVEGAVLVPVGLQDPVRVGGAEVLPVQHRLRVEPGRGFHERRHELVVALPAYPRMPGPPR